MANIVLPQVNILSEIKDNTNVLIEQDGAIQRVNANNFIPSSGGIDNVPVFEHTDSINNMTNENHKYIINEQVYERQYKLPYTNQLKTALNTDGTLLEGGYKTGARISSTTGEIKTNTGSCATGYLLLPQERPVVMRLKNIVNNSADNYGCDFYFFAELNTEAVDTVQSVSTWLSYYDPVFDNNNNLVQITISSSRCNYVAFSAKTIDSTSIVTFNEEIVDTYDYRWDKANYRFIKENEISTINNTIAKVNTLENKINNSVTEEENNSIPSYWKTELDTTVQSINEALCQAGMHKSAFLFYSDAHWNYNSQMSPTLLKYLYKHTGLNKTFFSGDVVNNEADDYNTMAYLWDWRNQLKDLPNHHSAPGNHDDGNTTDHLFTEDYVYGYLQAAEETCDVVRGESGLYYYIDWPCEKTRYLFLDTAFQSVYNDDKQKDFVKNALLSTPENWHIVAIAHIWHDTDYTLNPPAPKGLSLAGTYLLNEFDNYNLRQGNYTSGKGKVEFCVGGHTHWDYSSKSSTGIPVILVETDSRHVRSGLGWTQGTITESAVSGIIANYKTNQINIIRCGRGSDRIINIGLGDDPVITDNLLDVAGYVSGKRLSQSGGYSEADQDGVYLTGYIPLNIGETLYFKNMSMPKTFTTGYDQHLYFFDSNKTGYLHDHASDLDDSTTGIITAVWDSNNNLTSFTFKGGTIDGVTCVSGYVRINAVYIDENSIISKAPIQGENDPVITYTNQLPLAIDIDGSIYNGIGYKQGYRVKSSGEIVEDGAFYLTGLIPFKRGDIVRLTPEIVGDNPYGTVSFAGFDANKNFLAMIYFNNSDGSIIIDNDGNYEIEVRQLAGGVSNWANVAYCRISGILINDSSIITVNERINPATISYTNLIPKAVDKDGSTIYNGVGYKQGVRMSSSTGNFSTNANSYCTGYIPITNGSRNRNIIRFKNITNNSDDNYGCKFSFFHGTGVAATDTAGLSSSYFDSSYYPTYDENGNVTSIAVLVNEDYTHFVHSAVYIDENSIITINEEID